ncbi:MAG: cytochrome P450 [Myxococcota bacterium]
MALHEIPGFAPERPEFYLGDPNAAFAELRKRDPIHWHEAGGFWCVTRHADVRQISCHPRRFCSSRGTQLFQIPLARQGAHIGGGAANLGVAPSIIQMDPPAHNHHRKLVIGQFTPRVVATLEARVREIAQQSLAALPARAPVDFVDAVAVPLPMLVIAELLGIPPRDHEAFRRWSDALIEAGGGGFSEKTGATLVEMFGYLGEALKRRRSEPADDLISTLLHARIDGEALSEPEVMMFCMTLLVAGNETTRNLISGGTRALLDHPRQLQRLVADPALLPNAVEEMLRFVTPVRSFARSATEDVEVAGRKIAKDDFLVLFYGSANRDEAVFGPDADAFDIGRADAGQHIAFGAGEHLCLGAPLARLEARVLFEELLPRLAGLRYDGPVEPLPSVLINGVQRMPVVFGS